MSAVRTRLETNFVEALVLPCHSLGTVVEQAHSDVNLIQVARVVQRGVAVVVHLSTHPEKLDEMQSACSVILSLIIDHQCIFHRCVNSSCANNSKITSNSS